MLKCEFSIDLEEKMINVNHSKFQVDYVFFLQQNVANGVEIKTNGSNLVLVLDFEHINSNESNPKINSKRTL